jgi:hypothetical protein
VLTPDGWMQAGLRWDVEANAWLESLPGGPAMRAELAEEGALVLWHDPVCTAGAIYASCPVCLLPGDWLRVRRIYRGPVPRQVLAAFRPEPAS